MFSPKNEEINTSEDLLKKCSLNLRNEANRDEKSLKTFENYIKVWNKSLKQAESARNKLNNQSFNKNYKINLNQSPRDITLAERNDF